MSSSDSKCPVHSDTAADSQTLQPAKGTANPTAASCPVDHGELNPLNLMPNLPQTRSANQKTTLSTERELSSIPRSTHGAPKDSSDDDQNVWEYPSPQQFYNALERKGMGVEEDEIDVMVQIHNFLNEGAWEQVLKWEGLQKNKCEMIKLTRLQGRPHDLSPKARILSWFNGGVRPFDRHDWYVDRCGTQVRYVIDYYEAPAEGDNPVFNLDVRPALDSFDSLVSRFKMLFNKD
ncbi:Cytochrome c heme lyase [Smittium culicis]|uniref:Holocytochrome c-type synthase n=1 Tax=Smittium culicis TaxID=133412 RepID=A0A1R1YHL2_9FUNG|nr:Cytochrome c heme lyase [Smittium culicis]